MSQQVDLENKRILELKEGYLTLGEEIDRLTGRVLEVIAKVPEFEHIEDQDFRVVISGKPKTKRAPEDPDKLQHTIAECISIRDVVRAVAKGDEMILPPYLLVFYPPFFTHEKYSKPDSQQRTIIHELKHIKKTKKGVVPHTGFGDEQVVALQLKHILGQKEIAIPVD